VKVLIATLAIDETVHLSVVKMLLRMGNDKRVDKEFIFVGANPVDDARNTVIDHFLKSDCDYLISTDDDTGCDRNPIDLCLLGKDIIYLPTPYMENGEVVINTDYKPDDKGLCECTKGGTGCFILSRKAAETIPKPLFAFEYKDGHVDTGEDFAFSKKASQYFTLYCHRDYLCHHFKTMDLWNLAKR
jgi:hypothetical protein